jgi:hypothetical protein
MTITELISHLNKLPGDLPVYGIDSDRDWLPLRPSDVRQLYFTKLGRDDGRDDDFYVSYEDEHDAPNGVGIGI